VYVFLRVLKTYFNTTIHSQSEPASQHVNRQAHRPPVSGPIAHTRTQHTGLVRPMRHPLQPAHYAPPYNFNSRPPQRILAHSRPVSVSVQPVCVFGVSMCLFVREIESHKQNSYLVFVIVSDCN